MSLSCHAPRYADNILKTFANALSILQTAVLSSLILHDFVFTGYFFIGSILVIFATYLYSAPPPKPKITQSV
jgi:UDP-sugar transporter A1/2/3